MRDWMVAVAAGITGLILMLPNAAMADMQLRPLTTDRPDLTESPFTVNAGHVQFESTFFGYAESRTADDGSKERAYEFATTNIRVGVTQNTEFNIVWQPYGIVEVDAQGRVTQRDSGVGSLEIRGKVNLFGNDRFERVGDTALAVLPFVTIPVADNGISVDHVEGGIIVPFAVVLPHEFGLGLNAGISAVRDDGLDEYYAEVFLSAALGYAWTPKFGTYLEIAAFLRADGVDEQVAILGSGFTYAIDENTQLDGGINFGLTDASDRIAPFVGFTRRF